VTVELDRAALTARVAELEARIETLTRAHELLEAQIAYLRQPDDVRLVQNVIALLIQQNKPLPDDLEERSLRLLLRDDPHNFEHSRALIALLHRTGRPPLPDLPPTQPNGGALDPFGLEELLRLSEDHARAGDTLRVLYGRRPRCKVNLTVSEAFGCGHVFGL
jgi:hypothetical protein